MLHRLRDASAGCAYDGQAHRLRLNKHHAKAFGIPRGGNHAGNAEDGRAGHPVPDHVAWLGAEEATSHAQRGRARLVVRAQFTVPNHNQFSRRIAVLYPGHGFNQAGATLLLHQAPDKQDNFLPPPHRGRLKPLHIDADRMHDGALRRVSHLQASLADIRGATNKERTFLLQRRPALQILTAQPSCSHGPIAYGHVISV